MKMKFFSSTEIKEILVSFLALGLIFSFPDFLSDISVLFVYLLVLGVAFIGHELAHKFTAIKLGYWSEYRMWRQGILIALLLAVATGGSFVFAAPGAVYFARRSVFQHPSRKHIGLIGLAGPLFNAGAFAVSAIAYLATGLGFLSFLMIANAFLGLFNMIPFGPLDGKKIYSWNKSIWAGLIAFLGLSLVIALSI